MKLSESKASIPVLDITKELVTAVKASFERIQKDEVFFIKFLGLFLSSHKDIRGTLMQQDLRTLEVKMRNVLKAAVEVAKAEIEQSKKDYTALVELELFEHPKAISMWKKSLCQTLKERDSEANQLLIHQWDRVVSYALDKKDNLNQ